MRCQDPGLARLVLHLRKHARLMKACMLPHLIPQMQWFRGTARGSGDSQVRRELDQERSQRPAQSERARVLEQPCPTMEAEQGEGLGRPVCTHEPRPDREC